MHSNGFSLIRKIVALSGLSYTSPCPWDANITFGRALLTPTRIYVKSLLRAAQAGLIKGMSHITGGGFIENVPRVLPNGLGCYIDASAWVLPPVFRFLMHHGGVAPLEMARTFNNGVGMVLIVSADAADEAVRTLHEDGEPAVYRIGAVTAGSGVQMKNLEAWKV